MKNKVGVCFSDFKRGLQFITEGLQLIAGIRGFVIWVLFGFWYLTFGFNA
jgi:hypothetical protein